MADRDLKDIVQHTGAADKVLGTRGSGANALDGLFDGTAELTPDQVRTKAVDGIPPTDDAVDVVGIAPNGKLSKAGKAKYVLRDSGTDFPNDTYKPNEYFALKSRVGFFSPGLYTQARVNPVTPKNRTFVFDEPKSQLLLEGILGAQDGYTARSTNLFIKAPASGVRDVTTVVNDAGYWNDGNDKLHITLFGANNSRYTMVSTSAVEIVADAVGTGGTLTAQFNSPDGSGIQDFMDSLPASGAGGLLAYIDKQKFAGFWSSLLPVSSDAVTLANIQPDKAVVVDTFGNRGTSLYGATVKGYGKVFPSEPYPIEQLFVLEADLGDNPAGFYNYSGIRKQFSDGVRISREIAGETLYDIRPESDFYNFNDNVHLRVNRLTGGVFNSVLVDIRVNNSSKFGTAKVGDDIYISIYRKRDDASYVVKARISQRITHTQLISDYIVTIPGDKQLELRSFIDATNDLETVSAFLSDTSPYGSFELVSGFGNNDDIPDGTPVENVGVDSSNNLVKSPVIVPIPKVTPNEVKEYVVRDIADVTPSKNIVLGTNGKIGVANLIKALTPQQTRDIWKTGLTNKIGERALVIDENNDIGFAPISGGGGSGGGGKLAGLGYVLPEYSIPLDQTFLLLEGYDTFVKGFYKYSKQTALKETVIGRNSSGLLYSIIGIPSDTYTNTAALYVVPTGASIGTSYMSLVPITGDRVPEVGDTFYFRFGATSTPDFTIALVVESVTGDFSLRVGFVKPDNYNEFGTYFRHNYQNGDTIYADFDSPLQYGGYELATDLADAKGETGALIKKKLEAAGVLTDVTGAKSVVYTADNELGLADLSSEITPDQVREKVGTNPPTVNVPVKNISIGADGGVGVSDPVVPPEIPPALTPAQHRKEWQTGLPRVNAIKIVGTNAIGNVGFDDLPKPDLSNEEVRLKFQTDIPNVDAVKMVATNIRGNVGVADIPSAAEVTPEQIREKIDEGAPSVIADKNISRDANGVVGLADLPINTESIELVDVLPNANSWKGAHLIFVENDGLYVLESQNDATVTNSQVQGIGTIQHQITALGFGSGALKAGDHIKVQLTNVENINYGNIGHAIFTVTGSSRTGFSNYTLDGNWDNRANSYSYRLGKDSARDYTLTDKYWKEVTVWETDASWVERAISNSVFIGSGEELPEVGATPAGSLFLGVSTASGAKGVYVVAEGVWKRIGAGGAPPDLSAYETKAEHDASLANYETKAEHDASLANYLQKGSTPGIQHTTYSNPTDVDHIGANQYIVKIDGNDNSLWGNVGHATFHPHTDSPVIALGGQLGTVRYRDLGIDATGVYFDIDLARPGGGSVPVASSVTANFTLTSPNYPTEFANGNRITRVSVRGRSFSSARVALLDTSSFIEDYWQQWVQSVAEGYITTSSDVNTPARLATLGGGEQGPKGDKGVKGDQGIQGPKGDKGDRGEAGATAEKGDKGDKGDQGIQGPQGDRGATGSTGAKGDRGAQGVQGARGPQGIKGNVGAQGPQGEKGDKGEPGGTTDYNIKGVGNVIPSDISSYGQKDLFVVGQDSRYEAQAGLYDVTGADVSAKTVPYDVSDGLATEFSSYGSVNNANFIRILSSLVRGVYYGSLSIYVNSGDDFLTIPTGTNVVVSLYRGDGDNQVKTTIQGAIGGVSSSAARGIYRNIGSSSGTVDTEVSRAISAWQLTGRFGNDINLDPVAADVQYPGLPKDTTLLVRSYPGFFNPGLPVWKAPAASSSIDSNIIRAVYTFANPVPYASTDDSYLYIVESAFADFSIHLTQRFIKSGINPNLSGSTNIASAASKSFAVAVRASDGAIHPWRKGQNSLTRFGNTRSGNYNYSFNINPYGTSTHWTGFTLWGGNIGFNFSDVAHSLRIFNT